ncbi:MAG TPA: CRISPR system precrRNA processing endoribonuclease RAMP protein Cas6 [Thermoanaerobaculia bacterium]|nr:CRISPR system precrRNA processing endoribonuclease RAMP protein Cas6 [Thermoanaerobaculia bacterium]
MDPSYPLPAIPYLRLAVTLRAQAPAYLPPFKGSLLRGAFGHALRRTVCAMGPDQPCDTCRLRQACVYTRIFETFIEETPPPFLRGLPSSPRPYVFEPADETRGFATGDPLSFGLLLFGQATELQAYAQLAIERMAAAGLGSRRTPFALSQVRALAPDGAWRTVFEDGRAHGPAVLLPCLPAHDEGNLGLDGTRATIRLLTPLRLKSRGELATTLDFRSLVFAALRRVLELAHFHVPGAAIDWSFRGLLDRAAAVHTVRSSLTWHDWERYSNRQQTHMIFGGLLGTLDLEGDLAPFSPLFRAAEILHVGKGATFGLGKIAVEPKP